jgi:hypothetical protein
MPLTAAEPGGAINRGNQWRSRIDTNMLQARVDDMKNDVVRLLACKSI